MNRTATKPKAGQATAGAPAATPAGCEPDCLAWPQEPARLLRDPDFLPGESAA
ncbi:MAG: hypothetical protein U1E62_14760 [Alsobacter sp.]